MYTRTLPASFAILDLYIFIAIVWWQFVALMRQISIGRRQPSIAENKSLSPHSSFKSEATNIGWLSSIQSNRLVGLGVEYAHFLIEVSQNNIKPRGLYR